MSCACFLRLLSRGIDKEWFGGLFLISRIRSLKKRLFFRLHHGLKIVNEARAVETAAIIEPFIQYLCGLRIKVQN